MKPEVEVADIFRSLGDTYRAKHAMTLSNGQRRVMGAIEACRTAVLGGHVEQCADCGNTRIAYNSCIMGKNSNGESTVVPRRIPPIFQCDDAALRLQFVPITPDLTCATVDLAANSQ
jgi:hypothetical protein